MKIQEETRKIENMQHVKTTNQERLLYGRHLLGTRSQQMLEENLLFQGPSRQEKGSNQWYISCLKTQLYD